MHKVAVVGATLSGNKGAAAMLESLLVNLPKFGDIGAFYVLSIYPEADRALNTYDKAVIVPAPPLQLALAVPLAMLVALLRFLGMEGHGLLWHPVLRALDESDLLVDLSGISFSDGRSVELGYNVACILPAILLGKRVVKYAQAMGPFQSLPNRWLARWLLPHVALTIARGADTYCYLTDLGLEHVIICADAAFSLPASTTDTDDVLLGLRGFGERRVVGISPSYVVASYARKHGLDYVSEMAGFVNQLLASGYGVRLIAHAYRQTNRSGRTSDVATCRAIYEKMQDRNHCELIIGDYSASALRSIIGESDFFVASRFHAMVSALATNVPTLVTSWGHKYGEVLAMFGLRDWTLKHNDLRASQLWARFQDLVRSETEIRNKIQERLPAVVASADGNAKLTAEVLAGSGGR